MFLIRDAQQAVILTALDLLKTQTPGNGKRFTVSEVNVRFAYMGLISYLVNAHNLGNDEIQSSLLAESQRTN